MTKKEKDHIEELERMQIYYGKKTYEPDPKPTKKPKKGKK